MNLDEVREQFPAPRGKVFLDAACVSLAPRASVEAIQAFLENASYCPEMSCTLHHIGMDELRDRARPLAARLIDAAENEIALVESTTHGLSMAAAALPLGPGDRADYLEELVEVHRNKLRAWLPDNEEV
jgi:cysteine desulfurase/selenocysteine lyase